MIFDSWLWTIFLAVFGFIVGYVVGEARGQINARRRRIRARFEELERGAYLKDLAESMMTGEAHAKKGPMYNLPQDATLEDVARASIEQWRHEGKK